MSVKNQMLKDLKFLVNNLDNITDKKLYNDTMTDICNICKYLDLKIKYRKYSTKNNQVYEDILSNGISKEMEQVIIQNYLYKSPIKDEYEYYLDMNDSTLFCEFLNKDNSHLIDIYNIMKSSNCIEYNKNKKSRICGENFFIKSLNKNYITIYKKVKNKYSILIHELAHAKQNIYYTDNIYNTFIEMYPLFLQLIYSEFLKEKGYINKSYDIKKYVFEVFFSECHFLYEHIGVSYNRKNDYNYKLGLKRSSNNLLSCLLAMKICLIYIDNKQKALSMIDIFNNNINKVSDEELLNLMGLDMSIFNNRDIMLEFIFILKEEFKILNSESVKKLKKVSNK